MSGAGTVGHPKQRAPENSCTHAWHAWCVQVWYHDGLQGGEASSPAAELPNGPCIPMGRQSLEKQRRVSSPAGCWLLPSGRTRRARAVGARPGGGRLQPVALRVGQAPGDAVEGQTEVELAGRHLGHLCVKVVRLAQAPGVLQRSRQQQERQRVGAASARGDPGVVPLGCPQPGCAGRGALPGQPSRPAICLHIAGPVPA